MERINVLFRRNGVYDRLFVYRTGQRQLAEYSVDVVVIIEPLYKVEQLLFGRFFGQRVFFGMYTELGACLFL